MSSSDIVVAPAADWVASRCGENTLQFARGEEEYDGIRKPHEPIEYDASNHRQRHIAGSVRQFLSKMASSVVSEEWVYRADQADQPGNAVARPAGFVVDVGEDE
ncbi:hypothetical protein COL940_002068 [Colletotrichum noveboracense]|nr:hypothetical protein COL940_002068 [Colletotrichum noveboracense]